MRGVSNKHCLLTFFIETELYLKYNRISGLVGSGTANVNTNSQWSKQEACFACATQVWLAVNHNTSVISGK